MAEWIERAEGDACPDACGGELEIRRPGGEGCTCFINAPCWSCTEQRLMCSLCDWDEADHGWEAP